MLTRATKRRSRQNTGLPTFSPYFTRGKKNNDDKEQEKCSRKECVESAPVTINEDEVTLQTGDCFYVLIADNKAAILKINKLWKFDESISIECTMFTPPPKRDKSCGHQCGENELIEHPQKLLLHQDRFVKMIEKYTKLSPEETLDIWKMNGSTAIKTRATVLRRSKSLGNFIQLKTWRDNIEENVSAFVLMESVKLQTPNISKRFLPMPHLSQLTSSTRRPKDIPHILSYEDFCKHCKLKKALETGVAISVVNALKYHVVSDKDETRCRVYFAMSKREIELQVCAAEMDKVDDAMFRRYTTTASQNHNKRIDAYVERFNTQPNRCCKKRKLY